MAPGVFLKIPSALVEEDFEGQWRIDVDYNNWGVVRVKERVSAFAGTRTPVSKLIFEELAERSMVEALEKCSNFH